MKYAILSVSLLTTVLLHSMDQSVDLSRMSIQQKTNLIENYLKQFDGASVAEKQWLMSLVQEARNSIAADLCKRDFELHKAKMQATFYTLNAARYDAAGQPVPAKYRIT